MKYVNICALLALSGLPFFYVSAKKYPVETDNDDIVCTVEKYTQSQMLQLFTANLGNYDFDRISDRSTDYMALKLTLENNSQSTIAIEPEDYLERMGNAFLSKKIFLHRYAKLINENKGSTTEEFFGGGILILLSFFAGAPLIWRGLLATDSTSRLIGIGFGTLLSLFLAAPGFALIHEGISNNTKNKLLQTQSAQLRKFASRTPKLKKLTADSKATTFSPNAPALIVPPGHSLCDTCFIDLTKARRDFLESVTLKLIYEEVAP